MEIGVMKKIEKEARKSSGIDFIKLGFALFFMVFALAVGINLYNNMYEDKIQEGVEKSKIALTPISSVQKLLYLVQIL